MSLVIHKGVKFPCEHCDNKATSKGSILRHIKSKHVGVKISCAQCDYITTWKDALLLHIKVSSFLENKHYCIVGLRAIEIRILLNRIEPIWLSVRWSVRRSVSQSISFSSFRR